MQDQYNRNINYMRISLTDRCNLRCVYCRSNISQLVDHNQILRYEEILRVAQCAVSLGITRFKITGGEPLVRNGVVDFIARLKALPGVEEITLTTNGTLLAEYLPQLVDAKIDGINISLDTLDADLYRSITGGGELAPVMQAIASVVLSDIKCKLNCVPLKDCHSTDNVLAYQPLKNYLGADNELVHLLQFTNIVNEAIAKAGLIELCEYAAHLRLPLRFIELMPLSCNNKLSSYSGSEIRKVLLQEGYGLEPLQHQLGNGPAVYYRATRAGKSQVLGFIEPLHHKFCGSCNRVRLTSTGQLKPCLYSQSTLDLKALLRSKNNDEQITEAIRLAVYTKPLGHHFEESPASFSMNEIGG